MRIQVDSGASLAPARLPRALSALATAFTLAMVLLAIAGAVRHYSPVPLLDAWDASVGFFLDVEDGVHAQWWAQHNEHRLLLARVLTWLDYRWFGGRAIFLLCVNYLLAATAWLLLWAVLRRKPPHGIAASASPIGGLIVGAWLFQWMQAENLTWGMQVQFHLAYVLPLAALLSLARSSESDGTTAWFAAACALGLAAVGAMANGLAALPVLAAFAVVLHQPPRRIAAIAALAAIAMIAYLRDYHAPAHHGGALLGWREHPLDASRYLLVYLGSPFRYLFGSGSTGRSAALVAGVVLVGASAYLAWRLLPRAREHPFATALVFFVGYAAASGVATSGSRLSFGIETATASRYTTAALMAWAALGATWLSSRSDRARFPKPLIVAVPLLCIMMLVQQVKALKPPGEHFAAREMAALALSMRVPDEAVIHSIYPRPDQAIGWAKRAADRGLSVFSQRPYRDALRPLGWLDTTTRAGGRCPGSIDAVVGIPGSSLLRVSGSIAGAGEPDALTLVRFVNDEGRVEGYAITGGFQGADSFNGYVRATSGNLTLVRDQPSCRASVSLPSK